jgi:hypothetical protein
MVVPPGNHRGSDSECSRAGAPQIPADQNGVVPEAGWSAAQSASGATTFLRRQKNLPGFPLEPRRKARPHSPLSMPRLCAFAEQITLPHITHSRLACPETGHGEAAPTGRAYSSERRTARSAVAAGGSCIMRVRRSASAWRRPQPRDRPHTLPRRPWPAARGARTRRPLHRSRQHWSPASYW